MITVLCAQKAVTKETTKENFQKHRMKLVLRQDDVTAATYAGTYECVVRFLIENVRTVSKSIIVLEKGQSVGLFFNIIVIVFVAFIVFFMFLLFLFLFFLCGFGYCNWLACWASDRKVVTSKPGLDSDHSLSPITNLVRWYQYYRQSPLYVAYDSVFVGGKAIT
jgi:hypothetical protein